MNKLKSIFSFKSYGLLLGLGMILIPVILVLAPRKIDKTLAQNCDNAPSFAYLNFYPVQYGNTAGFNCTDFPAIDARLANGGQYSQSAQDWADGLTANPGDEVYVLLYVHNGAQQNGDPNLTVAKNVHATTNVDTGAGTDHVLSVNFQGDNTNTVNSSFILHTPAGSTLQVEPGSGQIFDFQQNLVQSGLNFGNTTYAIGDMQPCFEFLRFLRFKVRVVGGTPPAAPTATLTVNGQHNVTLNVGDAANFNWTSTNADQGTATYTVDSQDNCNLNGTGPFTWAPFAGLSPTDPKALGGSSNANIGPCQAGRTYTITYKVTNSSTGLTAQDTDVVTVLPNTPPPPPTAVLTVNGQHNVTLNVGDKALFVWTSTNANLFTGTYTQDKPDTCGTNGTGPFTWPNRGNTASGSTNDTIGSCQAGVTYFITYFVKNTATGLSAQDTVTVKVTTPATPSATLSMGTLSGNTNTCTFNGPLSWTLSNVNGAVITEVNPNGSEFDIITTFSNGSQTVSGLQPNKTYVFNLYSTDTGSRVKLANTTVTTGSLNCGGNPPSGSVSMGTLSGNTTSCTFSGPLSWTLTNVSNAVITETLPNGSVIDIITTTTSGSQTVSGLQPNQSYVFTLFSVANGNRTSLATTTVNTGSLNCGNNNTPTASLTVNGQHNVTVHVGDALTFVWSSTNVDQFSATYTVDSPDSCGAGSGTGPFTWPAPRGTTANGSISDTAQSCQANHTYTITYRVRNSSNGLTAQDTDVVTVLPVVTPNTLSCSAGNSSVPVNQNVFFTASGGNGTYSWTTNGANPNTGNGSNFVTVYPNAGTFTATVTSGSQSANCSVTITGVNNQFSQLSINKLVRNVTSGGSFSNTTSANSGDTVEFQITVSNTGTQAINNVFITDNLSGGFNLLNNSIFVNGQSFSANSLIYGGGINLGTLFQGQTQQLTFQAQVNGSAGTSLQNTALASGSNAGTVQAVAWVFINSVAGGNVNMVFSKRAFNDTRNADATSVTASREDFITYTLTATNNGNAPATNFVVTDDLSNVLLYADLVDNGGGSLNGSVLTFPSVTVPANGAVSKSFRVRIKPALAGNLRFVMTNTYGNTVSVTINTPQVLGAFIAPKTGADTNALWFAGLLTLGFATWRKRKFWLKFILA